MNIIIIIKNYINNNYHLVIANVHKKYIDEGRGEIETVILPLFSFNSDPKIFVDGIFLFLFL